MSEESENLSERSYQHIRQQVQDGLLKPGARLVNRKLADEIGVSVIPVREAIQRLSSEGLVEHIPGSGSFVRKTSREDLYELYVLRDAIESCAAAEAAHFITPQQLEHLETILKELQEVATIISQRSKGHATQKQFDRWINCEEEFHEILMEASRNRLLTKVIQEHRAITTVFESHRSSAEILTTETATSTCQGKEKLLEALRNRDGDLARKLMSQQIQHGQKTVLAFFRKQERHS